MPKIKDTKYDSSLMNPTCNNPLCQRGFVYGRMKRSSYDYVFKCKCSPGIIAPQYDPKYHSIIDFERNPHLASNQ